MMSEPSDPHSSSGRRSSRGRDGYSPSHSHARERREHRSGSHRSSHRSHRRTHASSRSRSPSVRDTTERRRRDSISSTASSPARERAVTESHSHHRRRHHHHRHHSHRHGRSHSRSRSRSPDHHSRVSSSRRRSISPSDRAVRLRKPLPSQLEAFTGTPQGASGAETPVKQKPNYNQTGKLATEANTVTAKDGSTVVLKYHEPPEARKPPAKDDWRLFIFKGPDLLETVSLSGQTCWLIGKEMSVVDLPIEHPSCSKQHAAIQFRFVDKRNEFGDRIGRVKPYLIDLESSNGTAVNGTPAPAGRYMELRDKDVIVFGNSSREYVLMLSPS